MMAAGAASSLSFFRTETRPPFDSGKGENPLKSAVFLLPPPPPSKLQGLLFLQGRRASEAVTMFPSLHIEFAAWHSRDSSVAAANFIRTLRSRNQNFRNVIIIIFTAADAFAAPRGINPVNWRTHPATHPSSPAHAPARVVRCRRGRTAGAQARCPRQVIRTYLRRTWRAAQTPPSRAAAHHL